MDEKYRIVESIGVISTKGAWNRELNIVEWEGRKPVLDIREWSKEHTRLTRGLTFTEAELEKAIRLFEEWNEDRQMLDFPFYNEEKVFSYAIHAFLGALANDRGWSKELNIVEWTGKEPKVDIRSWAPNHLRMSRGITLTFEEMDTLCSLYKEWRNAGTGIDSVMGQLITHFENIPGTKLIKTGSGEVKITSNDGTDSFRMDSCGKIYELSIRELSPSHHMDCCSMQPVEM